MSFLRTYKPSGSTCTSGITSGNTSITSGNSQVIRNETRTVTKDGITETTTIKVESFSCGCPKTVTTTTKTITTKQPSRIKNIFSTSKPQTPVKTSVTKNHSPVSSSESDNEEDFAKECLKQHNFYRAKHGVSNLKLNKSICKYAQEWANNLASQGTMNHRPNNKYGENIYMAWSSNPSHSISAKAPVDSWYSEISQHTFGYEPRSLATGHFTQVVWKQSKEFGVGIARSRDGKVFVVGNYDPPGNMIGSFATNVPAPKH